MASHRAEAFRALSNLVIDDPETKQALSKKENIKKVVARVLDPELDVRVAAIGTLRYLCYIMIYLIAVQKHDSIWRT